MATENAFLFSQKEILMPSSFSYFYDMKKKTELCDVTIRIGNRIISAHRVILIAAIPYFQAMLTSDMVEGKVKEVTIKDLDPGALESLINFAYTGEVEITTENVQSLFIASEHLLLRQVRDSCCDFLSKRLNPSNVMHFRKLAEGFNCLSLIEKCDCYIAQRFDEFSLTKEFQNLSFSFVNQLIRRDDIRTTNEEKVFEAVICWVKTDAERHSLLPELLTGIRMTLLTLEFLVKKASKEKLIVESFPCRDLLDEAKNYHLLPEARPASCSFTLSQRCYGEKSGMYQLRYNDYDGLIILKYLSENGTWSDVLTDRNRDKFCRVFALGSQIYVLGVHIFERFNLLTCKWSSVMVLPNAAYPPFKNIVPYGKRFYWLDDRFVDRRACYFDPEENKWHDHQQNVSFSDALLVSSSDGIYILDGLCERNGALPRSSKIYNPETRVITAIPNMPTSRTASGCAVLDGKIYVCGGRKHFSGFPYHGDTLSKCSEVYSPSDGQWRTVAEMSNARENFSLVPYNNRLYAIGGMGESGYADLIECFDPIKNKWTSAGRLNRKSEELIIAVVTSVQ